MKTLNELALTKKRLADLEESKIGLASQVHNLKEQLLKFEQQNVQQQQQQQQQGNQRKDDCKCSIEKEIQSLKAEFGKAKSADTTGEVVRTIEKYERQKEFLTENNQVSFGLFSSSF